MGGLLETEVYVFHNVEFFASFYFLPKQFLYACGFHANGK